MSDPNEQGAGVSVSIKLPPSKQYAADGMWLVLHGTVERVREDIQKAFGIEVEDGIPLWEVAAQADSIAHGAANAARTLGATSAPKADAQVDPTDPWAAAEAGKAAEPEVSEADKMKARIAEIEDVPALRDLFARNADLFNGDADLKKAWNDKGVELQAAAKAAAA